MVSGFCLPLGYVFDQWNTVCPLDCNPAKQIIVTHFHQSGFKRILPAVRGKYAGIDLTDDATKPSKVFEIKGFDTTTLYADYNRELIKFKAQDAGADTLSMAPRYPNILLTQNNIPDTGFGNTTS